MTNRDDFTESDFHEVASAVFDDEATTDEHHLVNGHSSGPVLLAAYDALRNDLREVQQPTEEAFAQMRSRAISLAASASPTAPPSHGRPVTNLASKRSVRSIGPKLVAVAAVAIVGIGAMALANLDRGSSSQDSAAVETARSDTDATSGAATVEANPIAPPGNGEPMVDGPSANSGLDDGYLGSFDKVDDLESSYRQRAAMVTSSTRGVDGVDESSGAVGAASEDEPGDETAKFLACGEPIARATLAGQEVVLIQVAGQIRVLDAATCSVIATLVS